MSGILGAIASFKAAAGGGGYAYLTKITAAGANGGTSSSIDTTGATLLIASVSDYSSVSASVLSDSKGNTWNTLTEVVNGTSVNRIRVLYCVPSSVGSGHAFTLTGSGIYAALDVAAFSGAHASPADQENGASFTSATTAQPGSVTPSVNGSLLIAAAGIDSAATPIMTGYTIVDHVANSGGVNFGLVMAYKIQTTASADNPTWSFGATVTGANKIGTFKPA